MVGRNAVLEAMDVAMPIRTAYVAEGAERDDRLRDIFKLAADRGTPLLEVTRAELDRLTGGALHQGIALQLPTFEYAHPDDLLATALDSAASRSSWRSTRSPIHAISGRSSARQRLLGRMACSFRNAARRA